METINSILASFDLTSIFSALLPEITHSFEKTVILLYETLGSGIMEVLEKMPFIFPVLIFLSTYLFLSNIFRKRNKTVKVRA